MNILGIETSCDETAAAVVQDGIKILSNVVASQVDLHAQYGGVVPEVAARSHIEIMLPVVQQALDQAFPSLGGGTTKQSPARDKSRSPCGVYPEPSRRARDDAWDQIDGIAVTAGPGLLGSLLVGTLTARTLAEVKQKPLYAINHVEAHTYANFLDTASLSSRAQSRDLSAQKDSSASVGMTNWGPPQFPLLALIVSGGHTQLVLFNDHHDYQVLGITRDDAAGEAFDKVAKLLGLGFPGGPAIAQAALSGNENAYALPKAQLGRDTQDFSFSGLKTAVLRLAQQLYIESRITNQELGSKGDRRNSEFVIPNSPHEIPSHLVASGLTRAQKDDLAASFQKTVVDTLVDRVVAAFEQYHPKSVVIAGGVAANQKLREDLTSRLPHSTLHTADPKLMTDNAAMIAALGYHYAQADKSTSPHKLQADSALMM
jgi:N6-L-threonylcarbamoyladenine synthase